MNRKRLFLFELLLMNIGLGIGTIGQILLILNYAPLVETGGVGIALGLGYVFFYVLLIIGVVGMDCLVLSRGLDYVLNKHRGSKKS